MRSLHPVNARRCIESFTGRGVSRRGFCAFLLPFFAAVAISLGATADDEENPSTPSNPVIEEFHVMFDGIDQYWISGRVTGCDDLNNLDVQFGDAAGGHSTTTGPDGCFGYLIILNPSQHTGTFSARATSHDNVASPWAVYYTY